MCSKHWINLSYLLSLSSLSPRLHRHQSCFHLIHHHHHHHGRKWMLSNSAINSLNMHRTKYLTFTSSKFPIFVIPSELSYRMFKVLAMFMSWISLNYFVNCFFSLSRQLQMALTFRSFPIPMASALVYVMKFRNIIIESDF